MEYARAHLEEQDRYRAELEDMHNAYDALLMAYTDACFEREALKEQLQRVEASTLITDSTYKITIPGCPVVLKNSKKLINNNRTNRVIPISSDRVRDYYTYAIPVISSQRHGNMITTPVHLRMTFFGAWSRKKNGNVPDLSNLYEAPQDLLTKCGIYTDDMLVESHDGSRRVYMCDTCNDRPLYKAGSKKGTPKQNCGNVKGCPYQRVEIEIFSFEMDEK